MADVTVKILTPATVFDLMTLDELKQALGISVSTQVSDDQWEWLIESNSATIAELCNRVFAKEEVEESWRDLVNRRVFLTHFPVKAADVESVTTNGNLRLDYELEEASGKLSIFTDQAEPIVVTTASTPRPAKIKRFITHSPSLVQPRNRGRISIRIFTHV